MIHWYRHRPVLVAATFTAAAATCLAALPAAPASALEPAASRERQLDRVQLHRNGARGVAYLPRSTAGGGGGEEGEEPDRIGFRDLRRTFLAPNQ